MNEELSPATGLLVISTQKVPKEKKKCKKKIRFSCSIKDCENRDRDRWFHRFPSNSVMRDMWIEATKVSNPTKSSLICSAHFAPADYAQKTSQGKRQRRILRSSAIPKAAGWTKEVTFVNDNPLPGTILSMQSQEEDSAQKSIKEEKENNYQENLYSETVKVTLPCQVDINNKEDESQTEVERLRAKLRGLEAMHRVLLTKEADISDQRRELKKKLDHLNSVNGVSKKQKDCIIKKFLQKKKFMSGQVEVMTKGLQRGHWESFEMEEFMHMYTLGDKLYSLQHEYMAAKFPSPSVSTVVMHLKNFKPLSLECDKCKGTFYSQAHLANHLSTFHEKFPCGQCEKAFKSKAQLTKHVKAVHLKIKPYQCKVCLRLFAKMENLDIHIAVTHLSLAKNDKEWKKVRSENKHLTAEYKETIPYKVKWVGWGDPKQGDPHSERKAFPCQEEGCLKSFPSKVTAARHARSVHRKRHKCRLCLDLFQTESNLENHICKTHFNLKKPEEISANLDVISQYKEVVTYDPEAPIDSEVQAWCNRSVFTCRECEVFSTSKAKEFREHLRSCHGGMSEKEYRSKHGSCITVRVIHECRICEKEITHSALSLHQHLRNKHNMTRSHYYYMYIKDDDLDV